MLNEKFYQLFDKKIEILKVKLANLHDIASSIQKVIELIIIKVTKHLKEITQSKIFVFLAG